MHQPSSLKQLAALQAGKYIHHWRFGSQLEAKTKEERAERKRHRRSTKRTLQDLYGEANAKEMYLALHDKDSAPPQVRVPFRSTMKKLKKQTKKTLLYRDLKEDCLHTPSRPQVFYGILIKLGELLEKGIYNEEWDQRFQRKKSNFFLLKDWNVETDEDFSDIMGGEGYHGYKFYLVRIPKNPRNSYTYYVCIYNNETNELELKQEILLRLPD